jgi:microcystin-dependent protein
MSTIKSSSADLTLNADGSGNDIKFQSNASEVGSLTAEGLLSTTAVTVTGAVTAATITSSASLGAMAGLIMPFANTSAPTGFLSCDGSAVSRSTYATLFTAIGTVWGTGDGSSTFNVPDLRGAFLRGTGSHGTSNMAKGTDFAGASVGNFENDQSQDHRHLITTDADVGMGSNNIGANSSYRQVEMLNNDFSEWIVTANPSVNNSQGTPRTGDETRPFNASILYCIKY